VRVCHKIVHIPLAIGKEQGVGVQIPHRAHAFAGCHQTFGADVLLGDEVQVVGGQ
jgi:hypothetical protein